MDRVIKIGMSLPAEGSTAQKAIESAVETLARVNIAYLRKHPRTPPLRKSGVRYRREGRVPRERWQSIPEALRSGFADCEDLSAWRIAELKIRGIPARPLVVPQRRGWHIQVLIPLKNGRWVMDPSAEVGM